MQEEKSIRWWPLMAFVWSLLAISIYVQVVIQSGMGIYDCAVYTLSLVGVSIVFTHLLSELVLPVFIRRNQLLPFLVIGLLTCVVMGLLFALIDNHFNPHDVSLVEKLFSMMVSALLITGNVCGMRFYREHALIEKAHRQLQNAHLEAELKLLRDQVNPHFLFNVMNSIHVLMKKDVNQASSLLLKFSDLLRHQLYDSGKAYVPVQEEVEYLKNYVNIEMVRWGEDVQTICQWPASSDGRMIAPFLLSPFVENAFKYVSHDREEGNYVHIHVSLEDDQLTMRINNTYDEQPAPGRLHTAGGLGLDNVKKRLQLLYPRQHQLQINSGQQVFSVQLTIQLSEA